MNNYPSPAHYENNPEQVRSSYSSSFKRISYSGSRSKRFFNAGISIIMKTIECLGRDSMKIPLIYRAKASTSCPRTKEEPGPSSTIPGGSPSSSQSSERAESCQARAPIGNHRNSDSTTGMSTLVPPPKADFPIATDSFTMHFPFPPSVLSRHCSAGSFPVRIQNLSCHLTAILYIG
jgi:hypothetical protein